MVTEAIDMEAIVFMGLIIGGLALYSVAVVNVFAALPPEILAAGRDASRFASVVESAPTVPVAPSAGTPAAFEYPRARAA